MESSKYIVVILTKQRPKLNNTSFQAEHEIRWNALFKLSCTYFEIGPFKQTKEI